MAELLVLYLADKKAAAMRLADAMGAAGYAVAPREAGEAKEIPGLAQAAEPPCVLVWSRGAVSSAVQDGWLGQVRTAKGLIEVSFDGITPPYADESRVILLSGWRGEPFHPGWQRVLERLKPVPVSPRAPAPAAQVRPEKPKAEREAPAQGRTASKKPAIVLGALLLVGAAAGMATWIGGSAGDGGEQPVSRPAAPAVAPRPQAQTAPASVPAPAPAPAVQTPPAAAAPEEPREQPASERPARKKADAAEKAARKPTRAADPAVKRYSRRHSATMRAFCEGTGRSTPQCRTFLRSTRDDASR
jgi:hypothetical protein